MSYGMIYKLFLFLLYAVLYLNFENTFYNRGTPQILSRVNIMHFNNKYFQT